MKEIKTSQNKVAIFEDVVYKGNFINDLLKFLLCKRVISLKEFLCFKILKINKIVKKISDMGYNTKFWEKFFGLNITDALLSEFWKKSSSKIRKKYVGDSFSWLTKFPINIFQSYVTQKNIIGNFYDTEKQAFKEYKDVEEIVKEQQSKQSIVYGTYASKYASNVICSGEKTYNTTKKFVVCRCLILAIRMAVLWVLCMLVTKMTLYYASVLYGESMYQAYFETPYILFLNALPIFMISLFIWILSRKMSFGFFCGSILGLVISWANFYKLYYRDDALIFSDILLISEGAEMAGKYNLVLEKEMLNMLIFVFAVSLLLFVVEMFQNYIIGIWKTKVRGIAVVGWIFISVMLLFKVYFNDAVYAATENTELINQWFAVEQYVSRGCIYPFTYSVKEMKREKPSGYNEKEMAQIVDSYTSQGIPEEKKVNVISIMLEAFNDFSQFPEMEFDIDPYKAFHEIEEDAYSGELVTNIFAAGTVDTERTFLSGMQDYPTENKAVNTYVSYFKEQGYTVEGGHPSHKKFYNRGNINEYYGFENYYFADNRYGVDKWGGLIADDIFIPDILELYEENKKTDQPYFNFSVTYQNHGPYDTEAAEKHYVRWQEEYNEKDYNIINNYLAGIENTGENLKSMCERLKEDPEPVILILFGDHNPWGGEKNSTYDMLGINIDTSKEEGFFNYYNTRYVIWANDQAKDVLDNEFRGEGPAIGPYFLMNEFFRQAGWSGNSFMQIANVLYDAVPVVHKYYFLENGDIKSELSPENQEKFELYRKLEYYWKKNK